MKQAKKKLSTSLVALSRLFVVGSCLLFTVILGGGLVYVLADWFKVESVAHWIEKTILPSDMQVASHHVVYPQQSWSWEGPFGTFDRASAQRGFQVYREVCSSCHALEHLAYRNLSDLGYNPAEIKAIAASVNVQDGPNDDGEMFERTGLPSDKFVKPYPNKKAAQAANGGSYPPDLSLIVKARKDGANYVYALLNGYKDAPADAKLESGQYYNEWFEGHVLAMAPPIQDGQVTFADGTANTREQIAKDVTTFLAYASDPHMEARKRMGIRVLAFVALFGFLMWMVKRKIWAKLH